MDAQLSTAIDKMAEAFRTPWEPERLQKEIDTIKQLIPIREDTEALLFAFNDLARKIGADQVKEQLINALKQEPAAVE